MHTASSTSSRAFAVVMISMTYVMDLYAILHGVFEMVFGEYVNGGLRILLMLPGLATMVIIAKLGRARFFQIVSRLFEDRRASRDGYIPDHGDLF